MADWPAATAWAERRDPALEVSMDRVRALVSEVRNARATAGIPAGASRPGDLFVPSDLAAVVDALAPAIERLARLSPLTRHADRADFRAAERPGSLAVIAGDLEARVSASVDGDGDAGAAERTRLERELGAAERLLAGTRARLADPSFTTKAPPAIVEGARTREAELVGQVARLRERLGE